MAGKTFSEFTEKTLSEVKSENGCIVGVSDDENVKINASDLIDDAPSDNKQYARKNAAWSEVESSGGGIVYPTNTYGLGEWGHRTPAQRDNPKEKAFHGDRTWLLDWRPYLIDYTAVADEEEKTPIAELKKNNWLRKTDGTYATVTGITSAQSTACNQQLYWDSAAANAISSDFYDTGLIFKPAVFWEYCKENLALINSTYGTNYGTPIEVRLYTSSGTEFAYGSHTESHIVAPWETTNNMLGVFIGRAEDVYLIDNVVGDSGKMWKGLLSSAEEFDGIDASEYKLARTGMAPGPVTAKYINNNWVTRSFFYNYPSGTTWSSGNNMAAACNGENMCNGNNSNRYCNAFYNNGHYPWIMNGSYGGGSGTSDSGQTSERYNPNTYSCQVYNRKNNYVQENPFPFSEGGYHALNTFLNAVEVGYGTKNFFSADMFSAGPSSNYDCNSETTYSKNGGIKYTKSGTTYYKKWSETSDIDSSANWTAATNWYKPKMQCLEAQIAASIATEMGISSNTTFTWNGSTWHYENATAISGYSITGLLDGQMNCRIYKQTSFTYNSVTYDMNLVVGLIQGMNVSGDHITYTNGGIELVVSPIEEDSSHNSTADIVDVFLQVDQKKWHTEDIATSYSSSFWYKSNSSTFGFEATYTKVGQGLMRSAYCRKRSGYTPVADEMYANSSNGDNIVSGSNSIGECFYNNLKNSDYSVSGAGTGYRFRKAVRFRGAANFAGCSPRFLYASNRAADVYVHYGCSAQVLLG